MPTETAVAAGQATFHSWAGGTRGGGPGRAAGGDESRDGRDLRAGEPARRGTGGRGDRGGARGVPGVEPHELRRARPAARPLARGDRRRSGRRSRALIEREQGKPAAEAHVAEVLPSLEALKHLSEHAEDLLRDEPVERGTAAARAQARAARLRALRRDPRDQAVELPLGPVAAGARRGARRRATRSCSSRRPPRRSSACGWERSPARRACRTASCSVLAVDDAVAAALVEDPRVGKIVFTGSVATGKKVMAGGREEPHAGRARARRQGRGDRVPRRRPRPRGARASSGAPS